MANRNRLQTWGEVLASGGFSLLTKPKPKPLQVGWQDEQGNLWALGMRSSHVPTDRPVYVMEDRGPMTEPLARRVPLHQRDSYLRGALAGFGLVNAVMWAVLTATFMWSNLLWLFGVIPTALGWAVFRIYTPWRP